VEEEEGGTSFGDITLIVACVWSPLPPDSTGVLCHVSEGWTMNDERRRPPCAVLSSSGTCTVLSERHVAYLGDIRHIGGDMCHTGLDMLRVGVDMRHFGGDMLRRGKTCVVLGRHASYCEAMHHIGGDMLRIWGGYASYWGRHASYCEAMHHIGGDMLRIWGGYAAHWVRHALYWVRQAAHWGRHALYWRDTHIRDTHNDDTTIQRYRLLRKHQNMRAEWLFVCAAHCAHITRLYCWQKPAHNLLITCS
jgi:hypothetical protein